jgi:PAS domain S-box-containing protein
VSHLLGKTTAVVLVVPLVAVLALVRVFQVSRDEQAVLRRYALIAERSLQAERLNTEGEHLGRLSRSYLLVPDPDLLAQVDASRARFDALARRLADDDALEPRERELVAAIRATDGRIRDTSRSLHQRRAQGVSIEELQGHLTGEFQTARAALDESLHALVRHEREKMERLGAQAHAVMAESGDTHLFAVTLSLAMLGLQALLALRSLLRKAASEARFSGIVSLAADAIITLDEAQRITLFNAGAETIFGHRASEVLGQPLDVVLPERFRARAPHAPGVSVPDLAAHRVGERQRVLGVRKSGEAFPLDAAISGLEVAGRRSLTVILRDVSEQERVREEQDFLVRAGEALSSTSLDYERTLSRVAQLAVEELADWCIVYLWDEGRVRLAEVVARAPTDQHEAARMRGFPLDARRAFLSQEVLTRRKPLLIPHVTPELLASVAQNEEHLGMLRRLRVRSFMGVPLVANERLLGALTFISSDSGRGYTPRDLEFAKQLGRHSSLALENARLYQSAREATLARDRILGVVAHDLRSPLQSILLTVTSLQRLTPVPADGEPGERQGKSLERLSSAAHRMNRMIEDLLDVARVEAGQLSIRVSAHPIEPLLHEALELVRPQAGDIRLVCEPPGHLPAVLADRDRLLQVFSNLLGNALKFTPPGGEIRVGARQEDGQLLFFVKDSGPGIDPEAQRHLFERFWQAQPGDRRGAGLGLSIVKGIVEAHGGKVRVESARGQGSAFFFSVPIAPPPPGETRVG